LSDEHQILIASKSCGPTEASLVRPTQPRVNKRTLQMSVGNGLTCFSFGRAYLFSCLKVLRETG
jgi:hypothetical protein